VQPRDAPGDGQPGSFEDLSSRLGATIRRLRRAQGLTLVELAGRAELSNPFLSQLERGRSRASMESLHRIARALGTTTPGLLAASPTEDPVPGVSLTRAGEGQVVQHALGWTRPLVTGTRAMYPVEFVVTSEQYEQHYQHDAAEMIYLLAGRLEVDLDVQGTHVIDPGDVLYLPGGVRHRWRSPGGRESRALVVQAGGDPHA